MHLQSLLLAHYVLSGIAKGAPVDDMQSLSQSCENAANVLNASLNNTMALNTSSMIQSIVWQVGASTANLNQTSTSNGTSTTLDATYFSYIDSVRTLAEATIRRGRIFHQEMNLPVYNALKSLATVVQAYGMQLSNADMISQNATIRTFSAGSSLVDAEGVWANNGNLPGPKKMVKRVALPQKTSSVVNSDGSKRGIPSTAKKAAEVEDSERAP